MVHIEESIQLAYAIINKYSPCDCRMYNKAKDSGYTDGYIQGLLQGHDNGEVEDKENYQKILK